jgi:hypothetical protein
MWASLISNRQFLASCLASHLPGELYSRDEYLKSSDAARFRAVAHLRHNARLVPLIRAAAAQLALGFPLSDRNDSADLEWIYKDTPHGDVPADKPPSENPELGNVLLPYLIELRSLAELLLLDADEAAKVGDAARSRDDFIAAINIAGAGSEQGVAGHRMSRGRGLEWRSVRYYGSEPGAPPYRRVTAI